VNAFSYCSRGPLTLTDAIRCAGRAGQVAILYTPRRCCFGLVDETGSVRDEAGAAIDLEPVFEARVFGEGRELRWVKTDGRHGRAALLGSHEVTLDGFEPVGGPNDELRDAGVHPLERSYLLWGTVIQTTDGWAEVGERRIAPFAVPVDGVRPGDEICLKATELVSHDAYGNAYVAAEMLVGLERREPQP